MWDRTQENPFLIIRNGIIGNYLMLIQIVHIISHHQQLLKAQFQHQHQNRNQSENGRWISQNLCSPNRWILWCAHSFHGKFYEWFITIRVESNSFFVCIRILSHFSLRYPMEWHSRLRKKKFPTNKQKPNQLVWKVWMEMFFGANEHSKLVFYAP